jgi:acetyl-CoA synthetase
MLERNEITTFGVSPTAIRVLMRSSHPARYNMDSLRLLGSTGEPWDDTSYRWFFENVGRSRIPVINISGGTEIIGCFLFPLPIQPLKPCTLGAPAPGMATEILDDAGNPVAQGVTGYLACTKPAPSMTRGVWGSPERYLETYWSKWPHIWHHGDWASVDEDGCWFLHGRADESMNVAGRKVGPAEVEDALIEHPGVSEAAVIGVPDDVKGESIVGFVVPKHGHDPTPEWLAEVAKTVLHSLGPTFRPKAIYAVTELPKTQSGKIVRRLIRLKYLGESLGDTSTVQNHAALDQIVAEHPVESA